MYISSISITCFGTSRLPRTAILREFQFFNLSKNNQFIRGLLNNNFDVLVSYIDDFFFLIFMKKIDSQEVFLIVILISNFPTFDNTLNSIFFKTVHLRIFVIFKGKKKH